MPEAYHVYYDKEPMEISSTYEGRHVTLEANLINSPAGGGVVVAKDPVTFGNVADGYGVGVAFNSGSGSDLISIDTEGIWCLDVVAQDDEGASAVRIGDIIYINRTTCVLSKISSDTTNIVFGYALDTIASGTHGIAVKVHWDPHRTDEYRDFLAGGTREEAMLIDIDDAATLNTGSNRAIMIEYRGTGAMTGNAERNGVQCDMFISGDTPYVYPLEGYVTTSGNPTVGLIAGLSLYLQDPGTACGNICGIDVGLDGDGNSPAGRHCFMRMRNHDAAAVPDAAFQFEGTPNADYFASWETVSLPIVAAVGDRIVAHCSSGSWWGTNP